MSAYLYLKLKDNQPVCFRIVTDSNPSNYKSISMLGPFVKESSYESFQDNHVSLTKKLKSGEYDSYTVEGWNVGVLRSNCPCN